MSLPTPEEVAQTILGCEAYHHPPLADGTPAASWCRTHPGGIPNWPCPEQLNLAIPIAARDEQVRADEWAQLTEADFIAYGVERGWLSVNTTSVIHMVPIGGGRMARSGSSEKHRYVTRWEPVEP